MSKIQFLVGGYLEPCTFPGRSNPGRNTGTPSKWILTDPRPSEQML